MSTIPTNLYFKGDGTHVLAEMIKRYGEKKGRKMFFAIAAKERLRPGDANNLRPKKR